MCVTIDDLVRGMPIYPWDIKIVNGEKMYFNRETDEITLKKPPDLLPKNPEKTLDGRLEVPHPPFSSQDILNNKNIAEIILKRFENNICPIACLSDKEKDNKIILSNTEEKVNKIISKFKGKSPDWGQKMYLSVYDFNRKNKRGGKDGTINVEKNMISKLRSKLEPELNKYGMTWREALPIIEMIGNIERFRKIEDEIIKNKMKNKNIKKESSDNKSNKPVIRTSRKELDGGGKTKQSKQKKKEKQVCPEPVKKFAQDIIHGGPGGWGTWGICRVCEDKKNNPHILYTFDDAIKHITTAGHRKNFIKNNSKAIKSTVETTKKTLDKKTLTIIKEDRLTDIYKKKGIFGLLTEAKENKIKEEEIKKYKNDKDKLIEIILANDKSKIYKCPFCSYIEKYSEPFLILQHCNLCPNKENKKQNNHKKGLPKKEEEKISLTKKREIEMKEKDCLLYTSPSPRDATLSRMPSSA